MEEYISVKYDNRFFSKDSNLHEQALLRVHELRLRRRDAECRGVESFHASDEAAEANAQHVRPVSQTVQVPPLQAGGGDAIATGSFVGGGSGSRKQLQHAAGDVQRHERRAGGSSGSGERRNQGRGRDQLGGGGGGRPRRPQGVQVGGQGGNRRVVED